MRDREIKKSKASSVRLMEEQSYEKISILNKSCQLERE